MKRLTKLSVRFGHNETSPAGLEKYLQQKVAAVPALLSDKRPLSIIYKRTAIVIHANSEKSMRELMQVITEGRQAFEGVKETLKKWR